MRKDEIHSIEYIFPVIRDDYGNEFWLVFINGKKVIGKSLILGLAETTIGATCVSGYYIISKNTITNNDKSVAYETDAFWKTKNKNLLIIEKDNFYIEEYKERFHALEWNPKSQVGYQKVNYVDLNLVTRFYVRKNIS